MAVYIRGLAFKCKAGTRRESVLLKLKETDENKDGDAWLLKYATVAVVAFTAGAFLMYLDFAGIL